MAPIMRRAVPVLTGIALAFTAVGSSPALAATTYHSTLRPAAASQQGHLARMSSASLFPGGELSPGAFLNSGTVTLIMQDDGNLVLYRDGYVGDPSQVLWASGTRGDNTAVMQGDGNFVIYPSNEVGVAGLAEWATNTVGNNVLEVQDDGNVVIYWSCCIGNGAAAVWATNTRV